MTSIPSKITKAFNIFIASEKSSGIALIICTAIAILITNSPMGQTYLSFWQHRLLDLSLEHLINDGLMAIFFLLIGLELKRELLVGELSDFKNALMPVIAAIGGMAIPALIYFMINQGTGTINGIGIPMATDIAFALGVLSILGTRVPPALKVFVVAFAIIDDLGAIVVIAAFYTSTLSMGYLLGALAVWVLLMALNKVFNILSLGVYLAGGIILWILTLKSGVHATVAGVLLAFAIPFSDQVNDQESLSQRLEHVLHKPVSFLILPIFALANTGIIFDTEWLNSVTSFSGLGITAGLLLGKPIGILLFCYGAVMLGICSLPYGLRWSHITGAGILGGIGFTMSIFITNLAFPGNAAEINACKMAILLASISAGVLGFMWLKLLKPQEAIQ